MPDFDSIQPLGLKLTRDRERELRDYRRANPPEPAAESFGIWDHAADLAAAPFRGAEGFFQGIYGLGDTILGDALPDWDERWLGRSETFAGGMVEGVSQFLLGFVPVAGWIGRGAAIGRGGRSVAGLSSLSRAAQAGRSSAAARGATEIGRFAAAGAVADFAVFDGHEARLSNLIQRYPSLENPVTEFLAADEDDPELVARAKGALEGIGLGIVTDGLLAGLRGLRAARKARAEGKSPAEVAKAAEEATDSDAVRDSLTRSEESAAADAVPAPGEWTQAAEDGVWETVIGDQVFRVKRVAPEGRKKPVWVDADNPEIILGKTKDDATRNLQERAGLADEAAEPPPPRVTEGDLDEFRARLKERQATNDWAMDPRKLTSAERLEQGLEIKDLNLFRFDEDPAAAVRALDDVYRKEGFPKHVDKVPDAELAERIKDDLRDIAGSDMPPAALAEKDLQDANRLLSRMSSWRGMLNLAADRVVEISRKINEARGAPTDKVELLKALESLKLARDTFMGLRSIQGRGLRSLQLGVMTGDDVMRALDSVGGEKSVEKLAKKIAEAAEAGGQKSVHATAREAFGPRGILGVTTEFWMNSILSGGRTLAINLLSAANMTIWRPFEQMMGAALTGNVPGMKAVMQEYAGIYRSFSDALQASKIAWDTEAPQLLHVGKIQEAGNPHAAITADNLGIDPTSWQGRATDFIGRNLVRWPGRALTATDEFFKRINYEGRARQLFYRQGLDQGMDPEAAAKFAVDSVQKVVVNHQALSKEMLFDQGMALANQRGVADMGRPFASEAEKHEFAIQYALTNWNDEASALGRIVGDSRRAADETTFTAPLSRDGNQIEQVTQKIQHMVVAHPVLRFVLPFIGTPFNIMKAAANRSVDPIEGGFRLLGSKVFGKRWIDQSKNRLVKDWLAGGVRKEEAIGRIATGMGMFTTFSMFAAQGTITGGGPRDSKQRQALLDAGWQPYSFKIGDSYVQYAKLDPFATIVGTIADFYDVGRYALADEQQEIEDLGMAALTALANNVTNKSYLKGVQNIVEGLNDPENKLAGIMRKYAASFVPTGPAEAASTLAGDEPVMREVRSMLDAVLNKLPVVGENLDPMRNFLGQPVDKIRSLGNDTIGQWANVFVPIAYREVSDNLVAREVAALNHSFRPPRRQMGGVDLLDYRSESGQSAYDRMLELRGEVKIGGRDLRRALRELMRSREYQRLTPESTLEIQSPRIDKINAVVQRYHREAVRQMRREFPELASQLAQIRRNRVRSRSGLLPIGQ